MGIKNNRLIFEMEFDILGKNKNPINNNGKDAKKIQDLKFRKTLHYIYSSFQVLEK